MLLKIKVKQLVWVVLFLLIILIFFMLRHLDAEAIVYKMTLGILITICLIRGLNEKIKLNPYLLFSLSPISLLIYDESVSSHYLVNLSDNTYWLAILNMAAVLLGFIVIGGKKVKISENLLKKGEELGLSTLKRHSIIFIVLGLLPTIIAGITSIGAVVTLNLNNLKNSVNSIPLSSVLSLFIYPAIVCALKTRKKLLIAIVLSLTAISILFNFSKTTIAMASITILVSLYTNQIEHHSKKRNIRLLFAGIVSAFLLYESFDIYNNIRHSYDIKAYFQGLGYVGNVSNALFLPYMYLISPWSNLQYICETTTQHMYGMWLIKPFLSYLQIDNLFGIKYSMVPRFSAFNTFTFISAFYIDFGFWGSIICSFLFGMFLMSVYNLYKYHYNSPYVVSIWALNSYAIVMLFFNNHYLQLSYPITIILLMWIWMLIMNKKKAKS